MVGPSGSGKTSFLRALAGLWSSGHGNIIFYVKTGRQPQMSSAGTASSEPMNSLKIDELQRPKNRRAGGVFFLPQRPYMVLGTLRQQLLYPTWTEDTCLPTDERWNSGMLHIIVYGFAVIFFFFYIWKRGLESAQLPSFK